MKRRFLPAFLAALLFTACSTPLPMAHNGSVDERRSVSPSDSSKIPWSTPTPGQGGGILAATPKARPTDASNIVTGGLRSGDGAISRNNIDALLNQPNRAAESKSKTRVRPAEERPGLATGYGASTSSVWDRQAFTRATSNPAGTDLIYYNDEEGIDAMVGYHTRISGVRRVAGEMLEWGVKGGFSYLPAYSGYNGRSFVEGSKGSNYSLFLKNRCKSRLEVVVSVDGLDVIDGKTASFSKRGYVIAPEQTLEIKGWRTSPDTVARFQFSSVAGSYANLAHGETRNVGVIGLAVFGEKGVDPWTWMPDEVNVRNTASPFTKAPGQN
jgi:hypothetical protein